MTADAERYIPGHSSSSISFMARDPVAMFAQAWVSAVATRPA